MTPSPWENVADKFPIGSRHTGDVVNVMSYSVFVELEPCLEGLLHISELADHKVGSPEDVVKVGDEVEVKILRADAGERKVALSRKRLLAQKSPADGAVPLSPGRPTGSCAAAPVNCSICPGE
jgi:small subunit ribosomal protein S1